MKKILIAAAVLLGANITRFAESAPAHVDPRDSRNTVAAAAAKADDWGSAVWISEGKSLPAREEDFYQEDPAPQFRKTFSPARQVQSARLQIAGLGFYEAHLNGRALADCAIAPLWTPYRQRALYDTYEVTDLLQKGRNVLTATLGNGWFTETAPFVGIAERGFGGRSGPIGWAMGVPIMIRPQATGGLTWARGHYATPKGPVRVDWRLANGRMKLSLELPQGVSATVWLADEQKWTDAKAGKNEW